MENARILRVGTEILNTYNLLVPTNARIILIYILPYPVATCFGWSPTSGNSTKWGELYIILYVEI